jgi:translation initiation factor eIF-2B subunit delta
MKELDKKTRDITFDRLSGASQLARKTLGVLRYFAQKNKTESYQEFIEDFTELGKTLFESRPDMAPVQNLVAQTVYEVNTLKQHDLVSVRNFAVSRIDELRKQSENAVKKSAEHAATVIANSGTVATCSYSSTICETIKVAKQKGKRFKVLVAESRSADYRFRYGQTLVKVLKLVNVNAEVFADDQISKYVKKVDSVLVGADSLLCDGSVINGSPSYELAVEAKKCGIPFYSVFETTKANALSCLGKTVEVKEGFDMVPPQLITGVITEKGIISTDEIGELMKEKEKFLTVFQHE